MSTDLPVIGNSTSLLAISLTRGQAKTIGFTSDVDLPGGTYTVAVGETDVPVTQDDARTLSVAFPAENAALLWQQWRLQLDGDDFAGGLIIETMPSNPPGTTDQALVVNLGDQVVNLTVTIVGGGTAGEWTALVPLTGDLSGDGFADATDMFGGPGAYPMGLSWRASADGRVLVEGVMLYVASGAPGVPDAGDLIATLPEGARPVRPAAVWATQFNFDTEAVTLAAIGITPAGEIHLQAAPAPVGQLYAIGSEFDPA